MSSIGGGSDGRTWAGIDVLSESGFEQLAGKRVGLVTHPAAVTANRFVYWNHLRLRATHELFARQTVFQLGALFGPEHGFGGSAQDLESVPGVGTDTYTGCPVYSLYGDTFESLRPTPDMLRGLDVLVIDLQDIGSRYYTFQATILYCMEACAAAGLPVMVLDRQNPIAHVMFRRMEGRTPVGQVEGPTIRAGFESFVGPHPIAITHGMTLGELATLYRAERVPSCDLTVVPCHNPEGFRPQDVFDGPAPSPNMPRLTTAQVYPGMCLVEGTNLSEGRGTTRPFEYVGFPGVDAGAITDRLRAEQIDGVDFLPVYFRPTFQKHAGRTCGGVCLVPRTGFRPVRTGLAILCAFRDLLGDQFRWRTERYEFVDHIPAIDLLFGSDRERQLIEAGQSWREIAKLWEPEEAAFRERRRPFLLYPELRSPAQ